MLPLWFQIVLAIVGLGVPKALLDHYLSARLSERARWIMAIAVLVFLVVVANAYVEIQHALRHLSEADRSRLKSVFSPVKAAFSRQPIRVAANSGDGEASGYAQEFVDEFNSLGMKAEGPTMAFPMSANAVGIEISLGDLSHPPKQAELFAECLVKAKFKVIPAHDKSLGSDGWMLVIGSQPR